MRHLHPRLQQPAAVNASKATASAVGTSMSMAAACCRSSGYQTNYRKQLNGWHCGTVQLADVPQVCCQPRLTSAAVDRVGSGPCQLQPGRHLAPPHGGCRATCGSRSGHCQSVQGGLHVGFGLHHLHPQGRILQYSLRPRHARDGTAVRSELRTLWLGSSPCLRLK